MTSPPRLPGAPVSLWMERELSERHPPLRTTTEADVAVLGGGMAGLCTAWEMARTGRSVVLVEAGGLAAGVTGNTTAKLSALQGFTYHRLRAAAGATAARRYATSQSQAVAQVGEVSAELGIDCQWERADAVTYATRPEGAEELRAEAEAAQDAGLDAEFVTATALPFPVSGAVRLPDQAQFHPRAFLDGLARDLVARGGRIFEDTRATALHEGSPCRVTTAGGAEVVARDVVVATHYPIFDRALLFARMAPHRELVVAGRLPSDDAPGGMYLTPEDATRSLRTAPYGAEHRMLIATGEKFVPGTGGVEERYRRLAAWMLEHFPAAEVRYRWAAQDNWTTDGVPFIGPLHPAARHVYVATGFGGWGLSGGMAAGRLLRSLVEGEGLPWAGLYDPRRLHLPREGRALVERGADTARYFVGDRLPGRAEPTADGIARGQGAVVRSGARHLAVYRDEDGGEHALSARCTHLGCLVRFNDAERTWECPCHGSRFGTDGEVLQGPAVHPLKRAETSHTAPAGEGTHQEPGDGSG
ncbi:FAD-dependent oxidoreductase [Streptomyces sp. TS71-3]|uniref:FAD-dependent oxidoreductase n=1 Tax=Streptomyces sp. TS71-3 TaxID=2733862 RepID=UPI001B0B6338|nr:FAD-dependent oxidoreductase [Streptomyces sp. TS71-3]GHJ37814.1 iron-sulfur-binding protein [Streptomyces sp. TS71-3]